MKSTKIGILEDDGVIALTLQQDLQELGYESTEVATTYEEAKDLMNQEQPDLMLLDIRLARDNKDGVDFAELLNEQYHIPFIFITANGDAGTVARAKHTQPATFLMKPFNRTDIYTAIEIALHNFSQRSGGVLPAVSEEVPAEKQYRLGDAIFVKNGSAYQKVPYSEILYMEMDNQYLHIHTAKQKIPIRQSLGSYMEFLNDPGFLRVHRGYAVNVAHIKALEFDFLLVEQHKIPIGKTYRQEVMDYLRIS